MLILWDTMPCPLQNAVLHDAEDTGNRLLLDAASYLLVNTALDPRTAYSRFCFVSRVRFDRLPKIHFYPFADICQALKLRLKTQNVGSM
jgi:hypothetical protein